MWLEKTNRIIDGHLFEFHPDSWQQKILQATPLSNGEFVDYFVYLFAGKFVSHA
jgi:hypothetical protein